VVDDLAKGKIMDRRSALKGLLFLASAPAIIKIDTLMKLKPMSPTITYGNFKIGDDPYHIVVDCHGKSTIELYEYLKYIQRSDTIKMDGSEFVSETPTEYVLENNWTLDYE
jgi:hypothetical protein